MNYSPKGFYVWDTWFLNRANELHVFHLQLAREGNTDPDAKQTAQHLGHAVTSDLIDWETLPPALGPDPTLADDDLQPWTGSAVWKDDQAHLFYTMRGSANEGRQQKIGLATSTDLRNWKRHPGNPVLTPDPRWYATAKRPVPGVVDCRDLYVIPAPGGGWFGFFATRVPGSELPETSVIGCAYSEDLVHWEQRPPAFAPGKYACLEVPDVFFLNGKWYLLCLLGHYYGNRGIWSDPHVVGGTMFAVADRPEGPYVELDDNVLTAAMTTAPLSARSVLFEEERHLLYTDRERIGHRDENSMFWGTLTTPKLLRTSGDYLRACYSPRIEKRIDVVFFNSAKDRLPPESGTPWGQMWALPSGVWTQGDTIRGSCRTGWSVRSLELAPESFIFEANIVLESGVAAGLTVRMDGQMSGGVVALDAQEQTVFFAQGPSFDFMEKRQTGVVCGKKTHVRIVQRLEHLEVYVDDVLKIAFSRYRGIGGKLGLFVDRGKAVFTEVRVSSLRVTRPT